MGAQSDAHDMSGEFRPVCPPPTGLVRPVRPDPQGITGPTPGQARGPGWRQTSHGFFVPASVPDTVPEQRILEQSMRLHGGGAVTGWAGCRLARAAYFDGLASDNATRHPVPLLVPASSGLRSLGGSTVSREPFGPEELRRVAGITTASPVRSLFDEMRRVTDPRDAVVAMDMMTAAVQVSVAEMHEYLSARTAWRRSRQVAWALQYASERSLSPGEVSLRLVWELDARLPRPLVNQPVFTPSGRLICIADIFDPVAGVVGEYDGATHLRMGRRTRDIAREELCRRAELEYFKVTAVDMLDRAKVVDRLLVTRARAPYLRGRRGEWTLEAPTWWHRETAEDLLAHRDWLRDRTA